MKESSSGDGKKGREEVAWAGAAETTVVGARPRGQSRGHAKIPRAIEVLMKKASVDPAFRLTLLEKRADSAQEIDVELSAAETVMLNSVPSAQIEQIIQRTNVPEEHRRVFLGKIGAAMLAIVGMGAAGCAPVIYTGISPDDPTKRHRVKARQDTGADHQQEITKPPLRGLSDDETQKNRSSETTRGDSKD